MSTKTVEMYQAVCDNCGKVYEESIDGAIAWEESAQAITVAVEVGDWHESLLDANKLYCADCHDDENEDLHD
jgi:transcription initiation factor TFIIIB Brf1 subunit/transcription initiation factor TFIIB